MPQLLTRVWSEDGADRAGQKIGHNIYTRLFEHGYKLEKEELVDIKDDSFFRILKYSFEDLVEKHEEEVVEIIHWRLSTFIGDNLTMWSNVSTF